MTTVTDEKIAKVTRNVHSVIERVLKGSLDPDDLVLVLVHLMGKGVRAENLLAYARENCPKINWSDPNVPKAKRGKKSGQSTAVVNPEEFFVSGPKFYVDSDLARNIDLSPVPDDARELKELFALPHQMNDTAVQGQVGGKAALYAKRMTPSQLMRECKRALAGETTLFQVGQYYLLYLEGKNAALCPVIVCWYVGRLRVVCYRFGQFGDWRPGGVVCGN